MSLRLAAAAVLAAVAVLVAWSEHAQASASQTPTATPAPSSPVASRSPVPRPPSSATPTSKPAAHSPPPSPATHPTSTPAPSNHTRAAALTPSSNEFAMTIATMTVSNLAYTGTVTGITSGGATLSALRFTADEFDATGMGFTEPCSASHLTVGVTGSAQSPAHFTGPVVLLLTSLTLPAQTYDVANPPAVGVVVSGQSLAGVTMTAVTITAGSATMPVMGQTVVAC